MLACSVVLRRLTESAGEKNEVMQGVFHTGGQRVQQTSCLHLLSRNTKRETKMVKSGDAEPPRRAHTSSDVVGERGTDGSGSASCDTRRSQWRPSSSDRQN
mmetsp:Transcript_24042/g.58838  ORF Transcript_24042/g.58838 Transcript_24042/m.58838 type:complete len:101 (-) Transcript_24042:1075-1377(-)